MLYPEDARYLIGGESRIAHHDLAEHVPDPERSLGPTRYSTSSLTASYTWISIRFDSNTICPSATQTTSFNHA